MTNEFIMDMHNHSTWSDGANTPAEIIENAIRHNISTIGITDHLQTSKCPSIRFSRVSSYISELTALKHYYKDSINVLAGIEIAPYPYPRYFKRIPFGKLAGADYVLIEYLEYMSPEASLNEIAEYINKFKCRVGLAHTDLLRFADNYGGLDNVMEFLSKNNIFWEINSNSLYEFFDDIIQRSPNDDVNSLIKAVQNYKIEISIGSDTHDLRHYEFDRLYRANKADEIYKLITI